MRSVWGTTLKTNAEYIPLVERNEGEEIMNILRAECFDNLNLQGLK